MGNAEQYLRDSGHIYHCFLQYIVILLSTSVGIAENPANFSQLLYISPHPTNTYLIPKDIPISPLPSKIPFFHGCVKSHSNPKTIQRDG